MDKTKVKKYQAIISLICIIVIVCIIIFGINNTKRQTDTTNETAINTTVKETNTIKEPEMETDLEEVVITATKTVLTANTTKIMANKIVKVKPIKTKIAKTTKIKKIHKKKTTKKKHINGKVYNLPNCSGSFKSYTNYKLLSKSSPQWTKIQCHEDAWTDSNGLRKLGDYYCVAMGSYYSKTLGDIFEIKTTSGKFKVIICDWKANCDTDSNNQYTTSNGCVTEFYVDTSILNSKAKQMGDISYVNSKFSGKITKITKLGNYFSK